MKSYVKVAVFVALFASAYFAFKQFDLGQYTTLEYLKARQLELQQNYSEQPVQTIAWYMAIYILVTALSLPGAALLTLAGGALFGFGTGVWVVSFSSTIGATVAFWVSRFLLRESFQKKFQTQLQGFNEGIRREGALYLFTLRLVPIFPFFLINLVMGLTPLRTRVFFIVSQLGMLPGTAAYVNAGTELSQISSLQGILSPSLLMSFAFIGILPLFSKWLIRALKVRNIYSRFQKPKRFDYNLVAIGAGSAGLVTAYIAAAVKAKVALVEKHKMGGDCLNTGCVPSKALIKSARVLHAISKVQKYGIKEASASFDFKDIMERIRNVIEKIEPHDSVERYSGLGVECIQGTAKIRSPWEVEVDGKILTTKNIVIATGARPTVPNIPGLEKIRYLTSENIWTLAEKPKRLIVLGAGPIGCELAQSFARLGSEVTQIELGPRLMGREDSDVSEIVLGQFQKEGIRVLTSTEVQEIRVEGARKEVVCKTTSGDLRLEFDEILLAVGRTANVAGFGLEELGVEISPRGTIVVDDYLRTRFPNIFACGDVAGPYQFTHTASHMAWYCAVNALFGNFKKFKIEYDVIPWATFTDPEVARVGLNEVEAQERGIPYQVFKYDFDDLDRAIADGSDHGFVKILVQPGTDKILGATIVGEHAGDIIIEYVTAMKFGLGLNKILGTIHIYPTLSEANKFAAGVWKRETQPVSLLRYVAKFHAFMRS